MSKLISKRIFLKGFAAAAAGAAAAPLVHAKPGDPLPQKWDREADVVILGYGGAGASAAITAKDAGADVVIFEKCPQGGGGIRTAIDYQRLSLDEFYIGTVVGTFETVA